MALEDHPQSSPQSVVTLPTEIIIEILSRLPVRSLLRCRSDCKQWRSLISDPHFIKSHLNLSTTNTHYTHHRLIFTISRRTTLKTCYLRHALYDHSVNALESVQCPFQRPRKFVQIVGSCNGLVCLYVEDESLVIWNPSTRKCNRLRCSNPRVLWTVHYGFGYDESSDDYKVVEMCCKFTEGYRDEMLVRIYSVRDGNWKSIGVFPHRIPLDFCGKFLNGALYWAVEDDPLAPTTPGAVRLSSEWNIVCFDLATETYSEVLQPEYDEGGWGLTLGTLREWLCVLCHYGLSRVDLWAMKAYGVEDSWTKLVSIPYLVDPGTDRFSVPLFISDDGKILLQFGSKLIVYDSNNSSFSEVQNDSECGQASTFVESLVSPMPAAGPGDRS